MKKRYIGLYHFTLRTFTVQIVIIFKALANKLIIGHIIAKLMLGTGWKHHCVVRTQLAYERLADQIWSIRPT